MRELGKRAIPIHVLIHIQPGDTMYLPLDHIARCYRAVGGACVKGLRGFREAAEGEDGGVGQRLFCLGGESGAETIRINL